MYVTCGMEIAGKVDRGLAGGRRGRKKEATEVEGCRDTRHHNFCTKMSLCDDACTMTQWTPKGREIGWTNKLHVAAISSIGRVYVEEGS